ncbi:MAG TPA: carboxylesterase family protein, partial [Myxococcota bacterium]|nr:carboxylesterase family protein [Myxococcota bacterium]
SGNWGLLDMLRALHWVQENAAAFGGDPGNVTIFGESAGAVASCALLASPRADGLFQRAILESGNCQIARPLRTTPGSSIAGTTGVDVGAAIATRLGCPASGPESLACLRGLPLAAITPRQAELGAAGIGADQSTIDGYVLEERPLAVFQETGVRGREVIIGSNRDEMTAFVNFDPALVAQIQANYSAAVTARLGPVAGVVLPLYPPPANPADNLAQYDTLFGELNFNCPVVDVADALASHGDPTRVYHFTQTMFSGFPDFAALGSFHSLELLYVFGDVDRFFPVFLPAPADFTLSQQMIAAWAGFAATGTPEVTPAWPLWDPAAPLHYEFNGALADPVRSVYRAGRCAPLIAAIRAVDADRDFVGDSDDNCPLLANSSQSDSDGDTLGDRCDACPASDLAPTLRIAACDTHIANQATDGCTLADAFAHCGTRGRSLRDRVRYATCVLRTTAALRRDRELRPRDTVPIVRCLLR